jgi:Domain of unknown function (DUF4411)
MTFTLDSNILINLNRTYPRDVFGSVWDRLEDSVTLGDTCICEAVLQEIHRGGDDLHSWAKNLLGLVCPTTSQEMETVLEIAGAHPEWVRGPVNGADPFVVAHAKAESSVLVTEENRAGAGVAERNQKIPNIADEHGVQCIKFLSFVRDRGWQF